MPLGDGHPRGPFFVFPFRGRSLPLPASLPGAGLRCPACPSAPAMSFLRRPPPLLPPRIARPPRARCALPLTGGHILLCRLAVPPSPCLTGRRRVSVTAARGS